MLWLLDLDYFQTGMDSWLSFYHNRYKEQSVLDDEMRKVMDIARYTNPLG